MGVCSSERNHSKIEAKTSEKEERLKESDTHHARFIPEKSSEKLFNSIVRIDFTFNEKTFIGTGFFIKFNIKNKICHYLMTCHHIINKKFVEKKITITLYYGKFNEEKNFEIKLDNNERNIKYFEEPIDVTLIEIIKKDKINEDKFLVPDLNYKNGLNFYKNNYFYLAGYPINNMNENGRSISSGKIINILDNSEFEHSLDTGPGNSGSPICLANNLFVVGIHKEGNRFKPINYGTFLGYILDNLKNENKLKRNKKLLKNSKLIENIKSFDVIKKIFSNLDEKIKLKSIKNNKKIQNIIHINLNNYKIFSGRYIEYETKGKGKEYNYWSGQLEYEGEYLNGKRNGKGKEYNWNGKLKFEGEYLNGKRNGKGKEYGHGELEF